VTAVRLWQDLTTDDFVSFDPNRTIAVLPVGAIEQHGPHLPLSTDAVIAEEIAHRAAAATASDVPLLVLPTLAIGKSTEHLQYAGTLTHSAETLLHAWMEVGESVHRAGIRKLVFLNAHGGQPMVVQIVARELRIKLGMLVVGTSTWSFGQPAGLVSADERRHGIHAGAIETSLMLHLRPQLVRMQHARDFRGLLPRVEEEFERLRIVGDTYVGWQAQDLHPAGVSGNATLATAEIGRLCVEHSVREFARFFAEVARYPLDYIKTR